jgi:hypothetical protein
MVCSKKAQASGSGAAIVVILITALIVLYVLFLPEGDRNDLLGTTSTGTGNAAPGAITGSMLLDEHPGTMTVVKDNEFQHSIPSFNLFTKTEDTTLKSIESFHIESAGSTPGTKAIMLSTNDRVQNAKLSFSVPHHSGNLVITQNEQEIFRGEVDNSVEPLDITLQSENLFQFSTEPVPWWKFFSKNYYDVASLKITGSVEKIDNKEALQTVMVSEDETNLMESAYLAYFVDCNVHDVGRLIIYLNTKLISSKVPDCGSADKIQIDPKDINSGKNEFRFVAEQGTYLLDRLTLRTQLKEAIYPLYFFSINSSVYTKIANNTINATLNLQFPDDSERKVANFEINSQKTRMDTMSANYSKNIDNFLKDGTNFIRIKPETTLNIVEMRIYLDCKRSSDCT